MVSTRVVAVYNSKGGVGKSWLTQHLGTGLAKAGRRVCVVDADPGQAHLTLRMASIERRGDLLRLFRDGASDGLLQQHPEYPGLFVVTADPSDVRHLRPTIGNYGPWWVTMLEHRMKPWLDGRFDYILFDCGPGFESEVTACVLQVATELWLPFAVELESYDSYQNLVTQLLPHARKDPDVFITHVIPNKLALGRERAIDDDETSASIAMQRVAAMTRRARTNVGAALLEQMKDTFGSRMTAPVRFAEAASQNSAGEGAVIWDYDPYAPVAEDLVYVIEAIIQGEKEAVAVGEN